MRTTAAVLIALTLACSTVQAARLGLSVTLQNRARALLGLGNYLQRDTTNQLAPDSDYTVSFGNMVNGLQWATSGFRIASAVSRPTKVLTITNTGLSLMPPTAASDNAMWRMSSFGGKWKHLNTVTNGKALCVDGDSTPGKSQRASRSAVCSSSLQGDGVALSPDAFQRLCTAFEGNAAFQITLRSNRDMCLSAATLQWEPCTYDPVHLWCQVPPKF